ncbi:HK97 gp10 family phage protein [Paenarthrobacter sp. NPDC089714]|uniref:HK97 gp10 family phage protein n=1 Tax=Paenarthrobacter sp. NPDC089714 TaxID=3364377 RepID=UPI0038282119
MAGVEYNDAFFERLGKSAEVTDLCSDVANEVASTARATAPRNTNDYADGISVEVVERGRRNVALVVAKDSKSLLIESKTGNLARALNQVKRGG